MRLSAAIRDYLIEIEVRKCTPKTIKGYRTDLGLFLRFCEEIAEIDTLEDLTPAIVRQFTRHMVDKGRKGTYINGLLKTIKSFIQYCYDENIGGFNTKRNFKWCKEEKPVILAFKPEHVKAMLKDCGGSDFMAVRDRAVLTMLFETGIRCWELCCMRQEDIHDDFIVIVNGKGHKQRVVPITAILHKAMLKYEYVRDDYSAQYDVVVADECHYFFADADYNHKTDLSFEWVMKQQDATRIFMSATCDILMEGFDKCRIPYTGYILERGETQIESLTFFWNEKELDRLAEQVISSGEKGIFFVQSAEKARNLYLKHKGKGIYLCSVHNKRFRKYINEKLVDDLIENERFDGPLLITTLAFDSGVTVKDHNLTTVVTDVTDPMSIIQCVGRKRFVDKDDRLNVFVLARTNQQISGILKKQRERENTIRDFLKRGSVEYSEQHERGNDDDRLIFDTPKTDGEETTFSKHVNWLKHTKIQWDIRIYESMLQLAGDGYISYVAKLLGCEEYTILEDDQRMQNLTEYLESIAGNPMLTKADREPFIAMMDIRHDRKLCKTSSVLAAWLESSGLPYRLHEYRTNRVIEGQRKSYRAWEVVKLEQ